MTQLRFHRGPYKTDTDVSNLRTITVNLGSLAPEHRDLILKHHDGGSDVWHHEWSKTVDGKRTGDSQIQRASHRIVAQEASLPSLIQALEQNERALLVTPTHQFRHVH